MIFILHFTVNIRNDKKENFPLGNCFDRIQMKLCRKNFNIKKMLKKLALISTSILILTACNANPSTDNSKSGVPDQNTSNPSLSQSTPTSSVSPVDNASNDVVIKLSDKAICEKITDPARQKDCLDKFNTVVPKAQNELDCTNPSDPKMQEACKLQQQTADQQAKEDALQLVQKEKQQQEVLKTESQLRDTAIATLDITNCEKIQDTRLKQECQINIILQIAQKEKNPAICDQLDSIDSSGKDGCLKLANN